VTRELRLAGLFTRGVAFTLDAVVINGTALILGAGVAFALGLFGISVSSTPLKAGLGVGGWLVVVALYFALFWTLVGQTPGMRVMGLRLITPLGRPPSRAQSARRLLGVALCVLTLGLGFLWVLLDELRRGLHDRVAGTLVVYDSLGYPSGAELRAHPL
jgi:uncharacterized RDD family membrane protein YckC